MQISDFIDGLRVARGQSPRGASSRTWSGAASIAMLGAVLAVSGGPAWADATDGEPVVIPRSGPEETASRSLADDDWQFTIAPYAWFIFINGTATFFDNSQPVNMKFDDIWEKLHFVLAMDAEVRKGDFGLLTDITYAYLWDRTQSPLGSYKIDNRMVLFDFALFAEIAKIDLGSGLSPPKLRLQPYFGGRYMYMGLDVRVDPGPRTLAPRLNTAAPILGLRGFVDINKRWNLSFLGDGGGFGVSGMERTWQAELLGGYRWSFSKFILNVMIGYKGLGMKQTGQPIAVDLIMHGPELKLAIEF
jgi:hypothetical protein